MIPVTGVCNVIIDLDVDASVSGDTLDLGNTEKVGCSFNFQIHRLLLLIISVKHVQKRCIMLYLTYVLMGILVYIH